jgi:acyl-coenzyme A synthetase/AMP-(fatty) acid ligase
LINAYGPTEATVCSAKKIYYNGCLATGESVSIGTPILDTHIRILDSARQAVDNGEVGENYISGPGVSPRGYLNQPALSDERFYDNLFPDSGRTFRTGDLGRFLPGGKIECLGCQHSQIKLHGQRIESEEIAQLLRNDMTVRDAAVAIRSSGNVKLLNAYIVCSHFASHFKEDELSAQLDRLWRAVLPSYSIPSLYFYIDLTPMTRSNKVDFRALQDLVVPTKDTTLSMDSNSLTPFQSRVAMALLRALSLPPDLAVNADTTYAQLGGSSLHSSIVLQYLNQCFNSNVRIGQFYRRKISLPCLK